MKTTRKFRRKTRKSRRKYKKRGGDTDTRFNRMKRFLKRSSMNAVGLKSKNQIAEEKQAKIQEIKNDLETNYDKVTANELMNRLGDNDSALEDEKRAKNDFYTYELLLIQSDIL